MSYLARSSKERFCGSFAHRRYPGANPGERAWTTTALELSGETRVLLGNKLIICNYKLEVDFINLKKNLECYSRAYVL